MPIFKVTGFIYKIGINRCIDIPKEISKKLGNENFIPVIINYSSLKKHTNLIPSGEGFHRLFIDSDFRKAAQKDSGDFIELGVSRDTEPRETSPPDDFFEILNQNIDAFNSFENSTDNKRREIIRYLNDAKHPDTRLKRIHYVVSILANEAYRKKRRSK